MISQDCIVPCKVYERLKWPKIKGVYVWVAYENKYPYLPIFVADTSSELAKKIGVSQSSITSNCSKYNCGVSKYTMYHRVKIGAKICE